MAEHTLFDCTEQVKEEWRQVVGYEGLYEVSSLGRIRRETGNAKAPAGAILKTFVNCNGYKTIRLCRNGERRGFSLHRLVALAFMGVSDKRDVNHIDGNKLNNRIENLEYVSHKDNVHHAWRTGLQNNRGENNGMATLKEETVIQMRKYYDEGWNSTQIAAAYSMSPHCVRSALSGNWRHLPPCKMRRPGTWVKPGVLVIQK